MRKIVVLAHGCWDILHSGHLAHLRAAKQFGDYLVVGVTTDRFIAKGPGRPHFSHEVRADMLRALRIVDEVVISDAPTAVGIINEIKPDFYVKGSDYANGEYDINAEKAAVMAHGGRLVFTDEMTSSSSMLVNRFLSPWSPEQQRVIEHVRSLGGMGAVLRALSDVSQLRVSVAGECILDIYRYVEPQGISSKSPSLSTRFLREESSRGGAWAIARHLRDFCTVVQLESGTVHKKIRYIAGAQRLFEVCEHPPEPGLAPRLEPHDVLLCADFGHGFFANPKWWQSNSDWLALNVQTNSSNFGYNRISRWAYNCANYLVADKREIALAADSFHGFDIVTKTLGPGGSVMFGAPYNSIACPAFADKIVDATGAGDAFLAITAPLVRTDCDPLLTQFIGNVFAGLKTRITGNSAAVSKASLLRACESILK